MKRFLLFIFTAAAVLQSCTDYLDIKPYGRTIPKTADEFSSLLHYHLNEIDFGEEVIAAITHDTPMAFYSASPHWKPNFNVTPQDPATYQRQP